MGSECRAIVDEDVALFGQILLQDNRINDRIERLDVKLSGEIKAVDDKMNSVDKRLAAVVSHVPGVPSVARIDAEGESEPR